jgi:hypothetical protein
MKRMAAILTIVAAVSACHGSTRPTPLAPSNPKFVLSGTLREPNGTPVAGATVEILDSFVGLRTTTSAEDGTYRFDGVTGTLKMRVVKEGYAEIQQAVVVAGDYVLDVRVDRLGRLISANVFRGVVDAPPCDPSGWDARAPCQRILYTPGQSGNVSLHVEWTGPSGLDLLFAGDYWDGGNHVIDAWARVEGGRQYEIRLNAYYNPVPFQIEVRLHAE